MIYLDIKNAFNDTNHRTIPSSLHDGSFGASEQGHPPVSNRLGHHGVYSVGILFSNNVACFLRRGAPQRAHLSLSISFLVSIQSISSFMRVVGDIPCKKVQRPRTRKAFRVILRYILTIWILFIVVFKPCRSCRTLLANI
jgi:hypothetical protein